MEKIFSKMNRYFQNYEIACLGEGEKEGLWIVKSKNINHLKAMNAQGRHIFIRPDFEKEPYFLMCDDLKDLNQHKINGQWRPGRMVIETSPENYQVWIRSDRKIANNEKKHWLKMFGSDPGASPLHRWGRCPGFRNRKQKYLKENGYPLARLVWVDWKRQARIPEIRFTEEKINKTAAHKINSPTLPCRTDYHKNRGESETDFAYALALFRYGLTPHEIGQRIRSERKDWESHKGEQRKNEYLKRTIMKAEKIIYHVADLKIDLSHQKKAMQKGLAKGL